MRRYAIYLPADTRTRSGIGTDFYITTSFTLAADFRTWGYRVDSYAPHHPNVLALLAMQRAEGRDQRAQETQLLDIWCSEWVGRWGFEGRVGAMLSEREAGRDAGEGRREFGLAVGVGSNNFAEGARAVKAGRRTWGLNGVRAWWVGRRCMGEDGGDGDMLPMYTKGEDPPAYEKCV